jgi:LPS-assembly lipoprotein
MRALILLAPMMLTACGLQPLYSAGSRGPVAELLGDVRVAPIEGQTGWLVRNALRDRLVAVQGGEGPGSRYRLDIKLEDSITGFGVRADDSITRERRMIRARYQLVAVANGEVLLDATAASDAGVDVVGSEYATIAAEQSAQDRLAQAIADKIVARLAVFARRRSGDPAPTP